MQKMFIVEGPDGSGKSTFIELAKNTIPGLASWKSGGPPVDMEELMERCTNMKYTQTDSQGWVIFDRFTGLSELIYGSIIRKHSFVPYVFVEEWLKNSNAVLLYCRPPDYVLNERLKEHHKRSESKEYKTAELTDQVFDHYLEIRKAYDYYISNLRRQGVMVIEFDPSVEAEGFLVTKNIARDLCAVF